MYDSNSDHGSNSNIFVLKASIFSLNSEEPVLLNDQQVSREGNVISEDDVLRIFDMTFKWKYVTKENA